MKKTTLFIKWYLYITSGILLVTAVCFGFYDLESLPVYTLWQIMGAGFLTTLVTLVFGMSGEKENASWVNFVLHYIALCVVMVICGNWFGWIQMSADGIIFMLAAVAGVYIFVFGVYCLLDLKQAKRINEKLAERYRE